MYFAIICNDKPDSLALRMKTRPAHVEHLKALGDTLKVAGPFTGADEADMNGSLLIVEAASENEAREIAERDPYYKAGLFADVQVRPWKWVVGGPEQT